MRSTCRRFWFGLGLIFFSGCTLLLPDLEERSLSQRLSGFPVELGEELEQPARISWNQFAVPFVEAKSDIDAFFLLGAVHAHLRLGQMELLKRAAQGRLAEMAGPWFRDVDHTIRILGLARVSREMVANLDTETLLLLQAFVRGINSYQEAMEELPPEYRLLQMEPERWEEHDVLTVMRLAGVDLSWMFYFSALRIQDAELRAKLWREISSNQSASPISFEGVQMGGKGEEILDALLSSTSRSGSNCVAVSGGRSKSGAGLIASDPHLGISIPNFWLLAGLRSPSFEVVGMMIPGVPVFALGRNREIAWGGTNMRAMSTHLYRLREEDVTNAKLITERIRSRWWFDEEREIRVSEFGPILTDSPFFEELGFPVALNWVGADPKTDELSSFLKASQASTFQEFREAFRGYGVSGQNMLFADSRGNIGQILAYRQPILADGAKTLELLKDPTNPVTHHLSALELPFIQNPPSGYLASANNRPVATQYPLAIAFSAEDRYSRMKSLLEGEHGIDLPFLQKLQRDTYSEKAIRIRDGLIRLFDGPFRARLTERQDAIIKELKGWDGSFSRFSRGALAYHLIVSALVPKMLAERYPEREIQKSLLRGSGWQRELLKGLAKGDKKKELQQLLLAVLPRAIRAFHTYESWGDVHRQTLQHPLGRIPVFGRSFRFREFAADGSNETLLKSGHPFSLSEHGVTYGAQSRHISDLSDIDANYFVLLGGQDGWLKSENSVDQVRLWRRGEYVQIPLSTEEVRKHFPFTLDLGDTLKPAP